MRAVVVELQREDGEWGLPVCGGAGVSVAGVPAHVDLCADGPDQVAGRSERKAGRGAGVSADGECLGAASARGGFWDQAGGRGLGSGGLREPRAGGEDHAEPAGGRAAGERAGGGYDFRRAGVGGAGRGDRAAGAVVLRRGASACRLLVRRPEGGGGGVVSADEAVPDHAPAGGAADAGGAAPVAAG